MGCLLGVGTPSIFAFTASEKVSYHLPPQHSLDINISGSVFADFATQAAFPLAASIQAAVRLSVTHRGPDHVSKPDPIGSLSNAVSNYFTTQQDVAIGRFESQNSPPIYRPVVFVRSWEFFALWSMKAVVCHSFSKIMHSCSAILGGTENT